jgi:hypothetical protein
MLPMSLHRDAVAFYGLALEAEDLMLIERYVRAAVLAAFASLEAQLNMAAQAHANAHRHAIDPLVHDVLLELEATIDEQGRIVRRRRRIPLTTRLCFLTGFLSGREFPRNGQLWQRFLRATASRDSYVHPKPPFPWDYSPSLARDVIDTISDVEIEVHRLMGLEPMHWWMPADELLRRDRARILGLPEQERRSG